MRKMQIFKMGSRYRVKVFSALTVYFGVDVREISQTSACKTVCGGPGLLVGPIRFVSAALLKSVFSV